MLSTMNIVRQKAIYEKLCDFKTNGSLFFPREDVNGAMYVVSNTGEIFMFNEGSSDQVFTINNSVPTSICFDSYGTIYVTDLVNSCVYFKNNSKYIFVL